MFISLFKYSSLHPTPRVTGSPESDHPSLPVLSSCSFFHGGVKQQNWLFQFWIHYFFLICFCFVNRIANFPLVSIWMPGQTLKSVKKSQNPVVRVASSRHPLIPNCKGHRIGEANNLDEGKHHRIGQTTEKHRSQALLKNKAYVPLLCHDSSMILPNSRMSNWIERLTDWSQTVECFD